MNYLQIPAIITEVKTLDDNSVRIKLETKELSSQDKVSLFEKHNKYGWFIFQEGERQVDNIFLPDLPKEFANDKTPSQRLRAVIYLLGLKQGKYTAGEEEKIEAFYKGYIGRLIEKIKERLD